MLRAGYSYRWQGEMVDKRPNVDYHSYPNPHVRCAYEDDPDDS